MMTTEELHKQAQQARMAQQVRGGFDVLCDEKDPLGIEQHTPGAKLDAGKLDLTYLVEQIPDALKVVCQLFMYGEQKYTRGGWHEVPDGVRRYGAARLRHIFERGFDESGFDHDVNVAWNALTRLQLRIEAGEPMHVTETTQPTGRPRRRSITPVDTPPSTLR
jgi:hypothetical protein